MARKRRRQGGWFKALLLFVLTSLIVWLLAFLIWFYWKEIAKTLNLEKPKPAAKPARQVEKPSKEKILDEDRKRLEEILKQRQ